MLLRTLRHGPQREGRGVAQWYEHGRPFDHFEGVVRHGKREGFGRYDRPGKITASARRNRPLIMGRAEFAAAASVDLPLMQLV